MDREFFMHFLRDPKSVGALVPLSQCVAESLIKPLKSKSTNNSWKILEVGAGTGSITRHLISLMGAEDQLDVVEIDQDCCELLAHKFDQDSRVSIHCTSILDWAPSFRYDFIVSTLPLNSFSAEMVQKILDHFQNLSKEGSLCTYVEYMGLYQLSLVFSNGKGRRLIQSRRQVLTRFHERHLLEKDKVFLNFLPCYVYQMKLHAEHYA
jgi:phosphatidylethanolamine/phosphatidyl-N-methylethanolamine N-methyltransferase